MGLYDGIKDVANVLRKADNVEIYKTLIDLSAQALEMQNEITRLSNENAELKRLEDISNKVIRYDATYLTLEDDSQTIKYCSRCWDCEKKLVQVRSYMNGKSECTNCENNGIYDREKYSEWSKPRNEARQDRVRTYAEF